MSTGEASFSSVQLEVASGFRQRLVGLLGQKSLQRDQGLLILPCNNIHTAFMRFSIDAVFVGREAVITKIVRRLKPYRVAFDFKAWACVELPSGDADRLGLKIGQRLDTLSSILAAT